MSAPGSSHQPTVLIVEDEEAARALTARMLLEAGYRVLTAPDGLAALAILAGLSHPVDVVLTDLRMPRMDGETLAAYLMERSPTPKIVFMSGFAKTHATGRLPGPFLSKPFDCDALLATVSRVLRVSSGSA
jgi:two-component system cell cycle sensor histidine kinase/response regulator CckA